MVIKPTWDEAAGLLTGDGPHEYLPFAGQSVMCASSKATNCLIKYGA